MHSRHLRSLACVLLLAGYGLAANSPTFLTAKTFSVGQYGLGQPSSVATADFNGDGKLDIVVANQGTGSKHVHGYLAVLLGNGDGTFKPAVEYTAGGVPDFVTVGDFNHDGRIDLVVANFSSNNVSILLGNGDGTFQTHMDFGTVNAPTSLAVGDFNNDGNLDVASTDANLMFNTKGSVAVLLGNGDGTLQPAVNSPAAGDIQGIAAGDFNGDGFLDLAVGNIDRSSFRGNLAILLGKGDGTFQPPVKDLVGDSIYYVVAADFNQDGKVDLALSDGVLFGGFSTVVLLGNGDGTFGSSILSFGSLSPMAVGDLNSDGKLDLALIDDPYIVGAAGVTVLYGGGDGTFQSGPYYYTGGTQPSFVAIDDLNSDHLPDLAVTNQVETDVAVLLNETKSPGQFRAPNIYAGVLQSAFADFNGDHVLDMVSSSYDTYQYNQLQLFGGNGDGTFQNPTNYPFSQSVTWVVTGDFNRDGKSDVAVGIADVSCQNPGIVIMLGNGDGTFGSPVTYSSAGCTNFIMAADVNGDGILDVITLGSVLLGNSDGTFQAAIPYSFGGSLSPIQFAVGDFNSDGKADLAMIFYSSHSWAVLFGNGDGTFQKPLLSTFKGDANDVATADLNGDGNLDLVFTAQPAQSNASLIILTGTGHGTFHNQASYSLSSQYAYGVAIADLNRDGKLDVAAVGFSSTANPSGDVFIFVGKGDGTFQNPSALSIFTPFDVFTPDLNGDGVPDMVVVGSGATPLLNTTP